MESNSNSSPSLKRKPKPIDEDMIDSVRMKPSSEDEEFFTASEGLTDDESHNTDCTNKASPNPSQKSRHCTASIEIPPIESVAPTKIPSPEKVEVPEIRTQEISEVPEVPEPDNLQPSPYPKLENLKPTQKTSESESIKTDVLSQTSEDQLITKPQDQNLASEELETKTKTENATPELPKNDNEKLTPNEPKTNIEQENDPNQVINSNNQAN